MNFTIAPALKAVDAPPKSAYDKDDDLRIDHYGPIPLNPFEVFRTDRGLSISQLSLSTGVNNKALVRLEKGMYVSALPRVTNYWVNIGVCTEGELLSDYEEFRHLQRKRHALFFGASLYTEAENVLHPFRQLRMLRPALEDNKPLPVGLFDTCEALCLPLDTVQHFEKKWHTQQSVPKELKACLNQIGYTFSQIANFEAEYKLWRGRNSKKVTIK